MVLRLKRKSPTPESRQKLAVSHVKPRLLRVAATEAVLFLDHVTWKLANLCMNITQNALVQ